MFYANTHLWRGNDYPKEFRDELEPAKLRCAAGRAQQSTVESAASVAPAQPLVLQHPCCLATWMLQHGRTMATLVANALLQ